MIPPAPPAVEIAAEASQGTAAVVAWGDAEALERLRVAKEAEGWTWATALLGGVTPALFLWPAGSASPTAVPGLVREINAGRFGKLTAGTSALQAPSVPHRKPVTS
jgi:hypothetical protein